MSFGLFGKFTDYDENRPVLGLSESQERFLLLWGHPPSNPDLMLLKSEGQTDVHVHAHTQTQPPPMWHRPFSHNHSQFARDSSKTTQETYQRGD